MKAKPAIGEPCNRCGLCCRIAVCATGSYAMGLVERWGERAPGPCPALRREREDWNCGLALRPGDFMRLSRGVTATKQALALMIGVGAGCDEAGEEPDATALPALRRLQETYLRRHGEATLRRAAQIVLERKR